VRLPGEATSGPLDGGVRPVRASVVPELLGAGPLPCGLLADNGFNGGAFIAFWASQGIAVLISPPKPNARPCQRSAVTFKRDL
jgi:hypothetical protein